MFDNIGGKCKTLAKVLCWLGIIASIIGGIAMIVSGANMYRDGEIYIVSGILIAIIGPLLSWLGSLVLYAIGEAAENSVIAANLAAKAYVEREQEKKNA
ncbi:MAG: hypothetical protein IJ662_09125 [Clostridia bacterium]|nr:hypothetical protein [Clostridia bacterium]